MPPLEACAACGVPITFYGPDVLRISYGVHLCPACVANPPDPWRRCNHCGCISCHTAEWRSINEARHICTCCVAAHQFVCSVCHNTVLDTNSLGRTRRVATVHGMQTISICRNCQLTTTFSNCRTCGADYLPSDSTVPETCPACGRTRAILTDTFNLIPERHSVGIEIEFAHRRELAATPPHGIFRHDGSINPSAGGRGREWNSQPACGDAIITQLNSFLTYLSDKAAYVNSSCGLHIHIGASNMTTLARKRLRNWWVYYEPLIFQMMHSTRRNNQYCAPTSPDPGGSRYQAFNEASIGKHNTIEIRLHHGTLNQEEILNWVRFLLFFFSQFTDRPFAAPTVAPFTVKAKLRHFINTANPPRWIRRYIIKQIRTQNSGQSLRNVSL